MQIGATVFFKKQKRRSRNPAPADYTDTRHPNAAQPGATSNTPTHPHLEPYFRTIQRISDGIQDFHELLCVA
jgi:hypothetical protein